VTPDNDQLGLATPIALAEPDPQEHVPSDLPPTETRIWTSRRKAAVTLAIRNKAITVWDACERYGLSAEELASWKRDLDRYGVPGLRSTRVSIYRKTSKLK
jgi:hypothetical protein